MNPRRFIARLLSTYYTRTGLTLVAGRPLALIRQLRAEGNLLMSNAEASQVYSLVRSCEKIPGEVAEVGVAGGGSAKLICEATRKPVHLFDTFEGLPELSQKDAPGQFKAGEYAYSLETVQAYLKAYPQAQFYKGLFPATGESVQDTRFSFVHLDVDLYESTLDSLTFFYPRMLRGGAILSHDYAAQGVRRAFTEFFEDKPEMIIEAAGDQCFVIKA